MSDLHYVPYSSSSVMAGRVVLTEGLGTPFSNSCRCQCKQRRWTWPCWFALIPFALFIFVIVQPLVARDIGSLGTTYPIAEDNLINVMKKRAEGLDLVTPQFNHDLESIFAEANFDKNRVAWLPTAKTTGQFRVDLTQTLTKTVVDKQGHVLGKEGQPLNPLDYVKLDRPLLFINGMEPNQVAWAKQQLTFFPNSLVILVFGNPFALQAEWEKPVYFDQEGQLGQRFKLKAVPARVTQVGNQLQVDEVAL